MSIPVNSTVTFNDYILDKTTINNLGDNNVLLSDGTGAIKKIAANNLKAQIQEDVQSNLSTFGQATPEQNGNGLVPGYTETQARTANLFLSKSGWDTAITSLDGYAKTSDLEGYAKTSDLNSYITEQQVNTKLSSYVKTTDYASSSQAGLMSNHDYEKLFNYPDVDQSQVLAYLSATGRWQVPPEATQNQSGYMSSADYNKLQTLPSTATAQRPTQEYLRGDGTWAIPPVATYENATTNADGLMSSVDKSELNLLSHLRYEHARLNSASSSANPTRLAYSTASNSGMYQRFVHMYSDNPGEGTNSCQGFGLLNWGTASGVQHFAWDFLGGDPRYGGSSSSAGVSITKASDGTLRFLNHFTGTSVYVDIYGISSGKLTGNISTTDGVIYYSK